MPNCPTSLTELKRQEKEAIDKIRHLKEERRVAKDTLTSIVSNLPASLVELKRQEKEAIDEIWRLEEERQTAKYTLMSIREAQIQARRAIGEYRELGPDEVFKLGDEAKVKSDWFPIVDSIGHRLRDGGFEAARRPTDLDCEVEGD